MDNSNNNARQTVGWSEAGYYVLQELSELHDDMRKLQSDLAMHMADEANTMQEIREMLVELRTKDKMTSSFYGIMGGGLVAGAIELLARYAS